MLLDIFTQEITPMHQSIMNCLVTLYNAHPTAKLPTEASYIFSTESMKRLSFYELEDLPTIAKFFENK